MLIQFLGGVDAGLILAGFVVTGMTMISLGSLSMAVSVSAKSSTAAIFITYGLSAFLFACVACFPGIGNPVRVFLFGMADDPGNPAGTAEIVLIVAITVLIHAFITSVCLVFATNQLRPVAQYVASFPSRSLPRPVGGHRTAKRVPVSGRISQEGWGPEELARPLDPDMLPPVSSTPWPHRRRPVTDPPMLWKEFYRERGASPLLVVYFGVVVAGLFLSLLGFGDLESRRNWAHHVGPVFTCLVLFVVPFGAAGSITRERERQTLDTLLVTPLERREILYGKWLGSIVAVRWPLGFLAGAYGLAALAGGMHWTAWPLLVTSWFVYAGFLASLGLFLSSVCSSTLRATLLTVLVTLGLGFTPANASGYSSPAGRFLTQIQRFGLSPPRTMMTLAFNGKDPKEDLGEIQAALIGVLIYAAAAIVLWEFSLARLNQSKGPSFRRRWFADLFGRHVYPAVSAAGKPTG
jgi:ABC-2 type transport system permease protein